MIVLFEENKYNSIKNLCLQCLHNNCMNYYVTRTHFIKKCWVHINAWLVVCFHLFPNKIQIRSRCYTAKCIWVPVPGNLFRRSNLKTFALLLFFDIVFMFEILVNTESSDREWWALSIIYEKYRYFNYITICFLFTVSVRIWEYVTKQFVLFL